MTDANLTVSDTPQPDLAPTKPDWHRVRTLYLQEVPIKEIAAITGASVHAIRCRAWRHRWSNVLAPTIPTAEPQTPSFQDLVTEFQVNMALSVVGATQFYANKGDVPENGRDAKDWETARETLIRSGRMLFGLDQQSSNAPSWGRGGPTGPVIDVTPVPLKPAS